MKILICQWLCLPDLHAIRIGVQGHKQSARQPKRQISMIKSWLGASGTFVIMLGLAQSVECS